MAKPRLPSASRPHQMFALAQTLLQQGRLPQAERLLRDIPRADPRYADALHLLGLIALQSAQPERGVPLIEKAVALQPRYPEAWANLGIGYEALKRPGDALAAYDKALALRPDLAEAHDSRGNALRELGRLPEAVAAHDRAIALRPDDAGAYSNRGNALRDLGHMQDALDSYDRAIALQPGFVEARCNRAIVLLAMQRDRDALAELDAVLARAPDYPEAHYHRGKVLLNLHRPEAALASLDQALALRPDYAEAWNSRGFTLRALHQDADALACFARAIELVPTYAAPHANTGHILASSQREEAALGCYERALALRPDDAETRRALGLALLNLKRYPDAIAQFDRVAAQNPAMPWLPGDRMGARRQICDWTDTGSLPDFADRIRRGEPVSPPFIVIGLLDSPDVQRKAAETFARMLYDVPDPLPSLPRPGPHDKIRLGYASADFRDHAMMHVMIDLFAHHDRARFELTAFSLGPDTGDAWRRRAVAAFDHFVDIRTLSDRGAAQAIRDRGIDILIDLMGYSQGCRPSLFIHRAAPVQATWLGYPGTTAIPGMDYIIADSVVLPRGDERHYTEHVVRLPETYQPNTSDRAMVTPPTRADQGLPDDAIVFCCFNNTYKIAPEMFGIWMRVLHRVPHAVLWLYRENEPAATNLRGHAAAHGIDPDRLIFAGRLPVDAHIARQSLADLFLDTSPYNGHATASLALWAGVPVLTRLGQAFAGRVAASLLTAIGLPELITATDEEYEAAAVALATDPQRLRTLRAKLNANRLTMPLFDTGRFAWHLEAAYQAMHARAQAGLPPDHIQVEALRDP